MARQTKDAIKEAFAALLDERPLGKITVRDIVERCGINRNTFYYHYPDIPSLLEEMTMDSANRIIRRYPAVDSVETAFLAAVEFAAENRRAVLHIYRSANRDIFEQHLWKVCEHVVNAYADSAFQGKAVAPEDREVISHFFQCACFGMAIEWMNRNMQGDVRGRIHRLCQLEKGMIAGMIARSTEEP